MMRYLTGVALALLPLAAAAAGDQEWYMGGGIGVARMNPDTSGTAYSVDQAYDYGGKIFAGYALNSRLSTELHYADLGQAGISPNGHVGYRDVGLSAIYDVYHYGDNDRALALFLRGGVGRMLNESNLPTDTDNKWHLMLGAGAEYPLDRGWGLRADLDLYDFDAQLFTVSIVKHFSSQQDARPVQLPAVVEPVPEPQVIVNPDLDGDGVANESDLCAETPAGTRVDNNGCKLEEVIILQGVVFASNSDELIGDSRTILDDVANTLQRYPEQGVEIAGYTDSQGSADYNQKLSSRRASAVRNYLITQGVSAEQLTARGFGEESPIADNGSADGRAKNRRVELHLVK